RPLDRRPVELVPVARGGERAAQAPVANPPPAVKEIESVRSIPAAVLEGRRHRPRHGGWPRGVSGNARELHDPVGLPRLAAVAGERLLESDLAGADPGPGEAQVDHAPLVLLEAEELAPPVAEPAGGRGAESSLAAV